jgi:hypothetical protein
LNVASGIAIALGVWTAGCELTSPGDTEPFFSAPEAVPDTGDLAKPEPPSQSLFYPLELGNRWDYARSFTAQVFPDAGDPEQPMTVEATIESEVTGTEELLGRTYWVQENRWNEEGNEFVNWARFRQDRRGLYEANISISQPPASEAPASAYGGRRAVRVAGAGKAMLERAQSLHPAYRKAFEDMLERRWVLHAAVRTMQSGPGIAAPPGGVETGELTRLQYPLHRGAHWTINADPLFEATVGGREKIELPIGRRVATRIRIDSATFGPNDRAYFWYDRCGELMLQVHFEAEATNDQGERIGDVVGDEVMMVTNIDLVRRGGCTR